MFCKVSEFIVVVGDGVCKVRLVIGVIGDWVLLMPLVCVWKEGGARQVRLG